MKKSFSLTVFVFVVLISFSQQMNIYPTHWWIGMKNPKLQLIIHQENIAGKIPMYKLTATGMKLAEGVILKTIQRVENPNYIFLDIVIDKNAKPGVRVFSFGPPASASFIPVAVSLYMGILPAIFSW